MAFKYPSNLIFYNRKGGPRDAEFPLLLFQKPPQDQFFDRRVCPVDCILVGSDVDYIIGSPQDYDRNSDNLKTIKINGMKAIRSYKVEEVLSGYYGQPIGYSLEERIMIQDPYVDERVILLIYYELLPELPKSQEPIVGEKIKKLFNKEKYKAFQTILDSLQILPIDIDLWIQSSNNKLGISFQHPAFGGNLTESLGKHFYFHSPLVYFASGLATIEFVVNNTNSANAPGDPAPPLFQYSGQPLEEACQENGYLNLTYYDVKLSECNLKTLPNGFKIILIKGHVAKAYKSHGSTGDWKYAPIPKDKRIFLPFKAAFIKTKSKEWPGLTIHTYIDRNFGLPSLPRWDRGLDFGQLEYVFDKLVSSLSYNQ